MPANAVARTTRAYQSSFGSFSSGPLSLAVDQSSGDVYAFDPAKKAVSRFTAAGAPHNFTAGPNAGTNTLTVVSFTVGVFASIAIDNSGGPLNGTVYVGDGQTRAGPDKFSVKAFASTGAPLGEITGSGTTAANGQPLEEFGSGCGVAVDQSNGALYVAGPSLSKIWRFAPSSPTGPIDDGDYTLTGVQGSGCSLAANSGKVYVVAGAAPNAEEVNTDAPLRRYSASDFTSDPHQVTSTVIDVGALAVAADPKDGDIYVNHSAHVSVFDSSGAPLYDFGAAGYFGAGSLGIAVKSASSGPAAAAYVTDRTTEHQIDVFGPPTKTNIFTHPTIAAFGKDGTPGSTFGNPVALAFEEAARKLYALDRDVPGLYGFDASAPTAFPPLAGFTPLGTAASSELPGLAVDNSGLGSTGRIYFASQVTDLLYGFDPAGVPLGGAFPLDPAASPGAPNGSPKDLCGVAVDSAGNIFVANSATKRILKYSSAGAYQSAIDTSAQGGPCQLAFDSSDNLYVTVLGTATGTSGVWRYSAASAYASAAHIAGQAPLGRSSITVDPSTDHLYVAALAREGGTWIDEYDPAGKLIDEFAFTGLIAPNQLGARYLGISVDPANHYVYVADGPFASGRSRQIRVFGPGVLLPEARTKPATAIANTSATVNGAVVTQGLALGDCHFEYVTEAAFRVGGFSDLSSGGSLPCAPAAGSVPLDLEEHAVSASASGLVKDTRYRFRLSATNTNGTTRTADVLFITAGPPLVETAGSPLRSATTVQLEGRVDPVRAPTAFHFEYGTEGPCEASPCASTDPQSVGSGDEIELVSAPIAGLEPDTTYHYRVVADNGNVEGPSGGEDMTVTTAAPEAPLSHGHFPGPPGNDRAWEMVSLPDSGGNPVNFLASAEDGEGAVYGVEGGTPLSDSGSPSSQYFAQRSEAAPHVGGWQTQVITPSRDQLIGPDWTAGGGAAGGRSTPDLKALVALNRKEGDPRSAIWRYGPNTQPEKLLETTPPQEFAGWLGVSEDASNVGVSAQGGALDPAFPAAAAKTNLYEIGSGTPRLISLLPGDEVAACGVDSSAGTYGFVKTARARSLSADGRFVFFPSQGNGPCTAATPTQLYARDLQLGETKAISGPPLSGPGCSAALVGSTPDAAFFWTESRLAAEDTVPGGCAVESLSSDGDVYRHDTGDGSLDCVTCVVAGLDADVPIAVGGNANRPTNEVGVSEDGSRVYFRSAHSLLPGTPPNAAYRVEVASGDLAYLGPIDERLGNLNSNPDGSVVLFTSKSQVLNPLGGGTDNGETSQLYRYDDRDRSLVCISCPPNGSAPRGGVGTGSLDERGDTLAFSTPTPLLPADQNTTAAGQPADPGTDVYEWRGGRLLLITDGLRNWTRAAEPGVGSVSPSGRDIFFSAYAQYTPDALDGYRRIYDARLGGGFEYPKPPPPCPLEVCQGTPKGSPEERAPGTGTFVGPGNIAQRPAGCRKGRVRRKGRCVAKKHKAQHRRHRRTAKHNGRADR